MTKARLAQVTCLLGSVVWGGFQVQARQGGSACVLEVCTLQCCCQASNASDDWHHLSSLHTV